MQWEMSLLQVTNTDVKGTRGGDCLGVMGVCSCSYSQPLIQSLQKSGEEIEVTSWLVSADDFSSRVARGANERVSAANE